MNGEEEDGDEAKVDYGVDENGDATCLKVAELDDPGLSRDLKQEAR